MHQQIQQSTKVRRPSVHPEARERDLVVREAISWVRTPYHHRAKIKGVGVDCGQLVLAVFAGAGLVDDYDTGEYPAQWMLHRDEERYLAVVEHHCSQVDTAQPGDIAVFKVGRTFAHGSIVIDWPLIIHANIHAGMVCYDRADQGDLREREFKLFSIWS